MRKLFYATLFSVLAIIIAGALIGGTSLLWVNRHIESLLVINKSLLKRAALYSTFESLEREFRKASPDIRKVDFLKRRLADTVKDCFSCHRGDRVVRDIRMLAREIREIDRENPPERIERISPFVEFSYRKALDSLNVHASTARASLVHARITIVSTVLLGMFLLAGFSSLSLRKIRSLEAVINDRERVLEEWARSWQETFDSISDMVAVVDRDYNIVTTNRAMKKHFGGISSCRELCRMLGLSHVSNKDLCDYGGASEWVEFSGKTYSVRTYRREGKGGCIVVIRDITRERELEERAFQSEKLASIGQMTATIAHEIKNPLTAVMGYSEMLMQRAMDDPTKAIIDKLHSAALRMERIINELLAFSRKPKLNRVKTDLNELIDNAIDMVSEALSVHGINIVREYSDLPVLKIDRGLIEQVFINILSNAIQAIADSGRGDTVRIVTHRRADRVVVELSDNGPGISVEDRKRIFEPFFTTKPAGKGTGLGLSLCYNFVTAHRGSISVRSEVGRGTTFVIEFPGPSEQGD